MINAFTTSAAGGLLALAGLTIDGGLAVGAQIDATGHAQAAARAGAQAIDLAEYRVTGAIQLDREHATDAVYAHLASTGYRGDVVIDGNTVTVTVTIHQPTQMLGMVGIDGFTVTGTGSAEPHHGVTAVDSGGLR